jgi:hypothetical protein
MLGLSSAFFGQTKTDIQAIMMMEIVALIIRDFMFVCRAPQFGIPSPIPVYSTLFESAFTV